MTQEKNHSKINGEEFSLEQRAVLVQYYPLVAKIVNSMRGKLPAYADFDELHSIGVSGLADAVKRLDPKRTHTFGGYVAMRVKGAIIDELRKLDYMPRSARSEAKNIEKLRDGLEQDLGRSPTDGELRDKMGLSQKQFDKVMRRTQLCSFVSLNSPAKSDLSGAPNLSESIADENSVNALEEMEKREMAKLLKDRIVKLPDRQKQIIESYYFDEKKLGEIAKDFGVTEARICQIHGQALQSLRSKMKN